MSHCHKWQFSKQISIKLSTLSHSQLLSDIDIEREFSMWLLLDSFSHYWQSSFINFVFTDHINDIKLAKNDVKNYISIDQSSYHKKTWLEMKVINKSNIVQTHVILINWMTQAQKIIINAEKEDYIKQNKVIEKAIQLLYFYSSHENQYDALQ